MGDALEPHAGKIFLTSAPTTLATFGLAMHSWGAGNKPAAVAYTAVGVVSAGIAVYSGITKATNLSRWGITGND